MTPFVLSLLLAAASLGIPPTATLIGTQHLPCGAMLVYFDNDGSPENGPEYTAIMTEGADVPVMTVEYGAGDAGQFQRAIIQLPGQPVEVYTTVEALIEHYGHPCDVVARVGVRT